MKKLLLVSMIFSQSALFAMNHSSSENASLMSWSTADTEDNRIPGIRLPIKKDKKKKKSLRAAAFSVEGWKKTFEQCKKRVSDANGVIFDGLSSIELPSVKMPDVKQMIVNWKTRNLKPFGGEEIKKIEDSINTIKNTHGAYYPVVCDIELKKMYLIHEQDQEAVKKLLSSLEGLRREYSDRPEIKNFCKYMITGLEELQSQDPVGSFINDMQNIALKLTTSALVTCAGLPSLVYPLSYLFVQLAKISKEEIGLKKQIDKALELILHQVIHSAAVFGITEWTQIEKYLQDFIENQIFKDSAINGVRAVLNKLFTDLIRKNETSSVKEYVTDFAQGMIVGGLSHYINQQPEENEGITVEQPLIPSSQSDVIESAYQQPIFDKLPEQKGLFVGGNNSNQQVIPDFVSLKAEKLSEYPDKLASCTANLDQKNAELTACSNWIKTEQAKGFFEDLKQGKQEMLPLNTTGVQRSIITEPIYENQPTVYQVVVANPVVHLMRGMSDWLRNCSQIFNK